MVDEDLARYTTFALLVFCLQNSGPTLPFPITSNPIAIMTICFGSGKAVDGVGPGSPFTGAGATRVGS